MSDISGEHAWNGAVLAAREINEAGGIVINGTRYFIGLVSEDTEEMGWALDIVKAVNATERMINDHAPHFVTGGFRTEAVLAYQEVIMDAKIPFFSTGVVADQFCQNVLNDYDHYKYFFRIMPYNTTSL
ncbi:MAG: ABC transporter substrate-binding protein, partial [Promethearchaeota archaeon]